MFFGKTAATEEQMKKMTDKLDKELAVFDKKLKDGRTFLCGDKISNADFVGYT